MQKMNLTPCINVTHYSDNRLSLRRILVVRQGFFEQLTALDWAHRYCQNFG